MSKPKRAARKPLPRFADEDQERRFWAKHDTADYFDWSKADRPRRLSRFVCRSRARGAQGPGQRTRRAVPIVDEGVSRGTSCAPASAEGKGAGVGWGTTARPPN